MTDGWGSRLGGGEKTHRKRRWWSWARLFSPGQAEAGTGAGAARGRIRGAQSVGGLGPARGRALGGSPESESRFLSPAPLVVHMAPAAAVSAAQPEVGPRMGILVVEGVFGEGVALGTEAPPDCEFISQVINSKLLYSENAVPLIEQAR